MKAFAIHPFTETEKGAGFKARALFHARSPAGKLQSRQCRTYTAKQHILELNISVRGREMILMGRAVESRTVPGLIVSRQGDAAILTLDKPQTLNALDLAMLRDITALLKEWADDSSVRTVIVRSSSPRAFCAGGDIRALRMASLEQRFEDIETFFTAEYGLSALIGAYPKPYVSLIDGYCMGGGMGISMHGSHRVVAQGAMLAMPETRIGFYPDVGMSFILPRLPAGIGLYLALTSAQLDVADALEVGLATSFVPCPSHVALIDALADGEPAAEAIQHFSTPLPGPSVLATRKPEIMHHFANASSVWEVVRSLELASGAFATETRSILRARCPTSLAVTFENMRRGAHLDLAGALAMEQHLCVPMSRRADYAEGIRAAVVDKQAMPNWQPARLEDVAPEAIAVLYENLA